MTRTSAVRCVRFSADHEPKSDPIRFFEGKTPVANSALLSRSTVKRLLELNYDESDRNLAKGALLLYDRVYVSTDGDPYESILDELCLNEASHLRDRLKSLIRPLREIWTSSPQIQLGDLLNVVLQIPEIDQAVVEREFLLWQEKAETIGGEVVNKVHEDPNPLEDLFLLSKTGLPYHEMADRKRRFAELFDRWHLEVSDERVFSDEFPPIDEIPLEQVIELRKSTYISGFRDMVMQHKHNPERLLELFQAGIYEILGSVKPSKGGNWLRRFVANLPIPGLYSIPVPNPFGVFEALREGRQERQWHGKYGWIFFFQEAREKVRSEQEMITQQ